MKKVLYILGMLSDSDVEWLITAGKRKEMEPGGVLIHEGKRTEALSIVLDGSFAITVASMKGREVGRTGAGEILGEISFVDSRPPTATVTAAEPSIVLSIDRNDLERKLQQDIGFAARFYQAVAVFLADRLRGWASLMTYNKSEQLRQEVEYEDEIDMDLLDHVSMAGARFEMILRRLRGGC